MRPVKCWGDLQKNGGYVIIIKYHPFRVTAKQSIGFKPGSRQVYARELFCLVDLNVSPGNRGYYTFWE
ncbi:MAG: hypothetical protein ACOYI2_03190 [Bacillota bacterium]|nr:hypothetical protein [Clostridia bacterium]